jgi:hypothetical protein
MYLIINFYLSFHVSDYQFLSPISCIGLSIFIFYSM